MSFKKYGTPQQASVMDKCASCKNLAPRDEMEKGKCKKCANKKEEAVHSDRRDND